LSISSRRLLLALASLFTAATLAAQNGTQVLDASALKPPVGARVAIVEFYDLECPACAHANPTIVSAAQKYKIPVIRHDFVIPGHQWSPTAALNARWFDTKSKALGDEYRDQVFANQNRTIYNVDTLRQFTDNFAKVHGISMPFAIDPQGHLNAAIQTDVQIGTRTGIHGTPSIFIVIANSKGAPYIEVKTVDKDLYTSIDQAFALAGPAVQAPASAAAKKPAHK
jgi:protein-disulfide isomerase